MLDKLIHVLSFIKQDLLRSVGMQMSLAAAIVTAVLAMVFSDYLFSDVDQRQNLPWLLALLVFVLGLICRTIFRRLFPKPKHKPRVPGGDYDW